MKINIQKFNLKEVDEFINFSKSYYSNQETTNKAIVKNKFIDYENQHSYHLKIQNGDEVLGRVVLNERKIALKGKEFKVTQVTDLLINQKNKDPLVFIKLVKSYNSLKNNLVIHASNENSENIYKKFFKFNIIFFMKSYGFPIKPIKILENLFNLKLYFLYFLDLIFSYIFKGTLSIISILNSIKFENCSFNQLKGDGISKFKKNSKFSMDRSNEFINWRFEKNPNHYYCKKIVKHNTIIGYAVLRNSEYLGFKVTLLIDLYLLKSTTALDNLKIRQQLLLESIKSGSDIFFSIINTNNTKLSRVFGFPILPINDSLLKHATPIFCSSINESINTKELSELHFTLADLDYF